jgi:type IV secretion system protein VirB6
MTFSPFNSLQGMILPHFAAVTSKSSTLIEWMAPFLLAGLTIYLIWYGIEVVTRGSSGMEVLLEAFLLKAVRVSLVFSFALVGGMYAANVVGILIELRDALTGLFSGTGSSSYVALDKTLNNALMALEKIGPYANQNISVMSNNFSGVVIYACAFLMVGSIAIYTAVAGFGLIMIDAALAIFFGFGPLFVACFAFQSTARFFDTWLTAVLKYIFTAVMSAVMIGIASGVVDKFAAALSKNAETIDYIPATASAVVTMIVLVFFVKRVPELAADMIGGAAISLATPGQAARAAAPVAGAAAKGAAGAAGAAGRAGAYAVGAAAGAAAQTSLGARVLKATAGMQATASKAATGVQNFGNAVAGRNGAGRSTGGRGIGNAFSIGRQAASPSAGAGSGTVRGGRPVPSVRA